MVKNAAEKTKKCVGYFLALQSPLHPDPMAIFDWVTNEPKLLGTMGHKPIVSLEHENLSQNAFVYTRVSLLVQPSQSEVVIPVVRSEPPSHIRVGVLKHSLQLGFQKQFRSQTRSRSALQNGVPDHNDQLL